MGRAVRTRGRRPRSIAATAHRRKSQRFESSWIALFTPESALSFDRRLPLTVEFHSVSSHCGVGCPHLNRRPRSIACRCSPSKFTGFLVSGGGDVHTRTCASFGRATACIDEPQSLVRARARTPPSAPKPAAAPDTRSQDPRLHGRDERTALRSNARADSGVDIAPPNRLANLCIRQVRASVAAAGQGSGGVDISRRHRLALLWISTVSAGIRSNRGPIEVWTSALRRDSKPCAIDR